MDGTRTVSGQPDRMRRTRRKKRRNKRRNGKEVYGEYEELHASPGHAVVKSLSAPRRETPYWSARFTAPVSQLPILLLSGNQPRWTSSSTSQRRAAPTAGQKDQPDSGLRRKYPASPGASTVLPSVPYLDVLVLERLDHEPLRSPGTAISHGRAITSSSGAPKPSYVSSMACAGRAPRRPPRRQSQQYRRRRQESPERGAGRRTRARRGPRRTARPPPGAAGPGGRSCAAPSRGGPPRAGAAPS
ncbi:unnamed protein product [Prorocentrum cordatum]|uniref:Uncharacterized protein n=1 Tax=Prorocentrum cordatum TaxID=2364126 RepID=A0ABN9VJI6_9DINO|nr:unnamed protein product [Polarella glacialis]